jgi:hypothetical protein
MSYNPASITVANGNLPNLLATYYERQAIPNLKARTPFMSMAKQKPLPLNSGHNIQFYTYALLGANTTQSAEGTVGSPISESSTSINATIGQYADFINSSDLSLAVAIDEGGLLNNLATELNYRLALTMNTLVQMTSDAAVAVDNRVNIIIPHGSFLTANTVRSAVQNLVGVDARPMLPNGSMGGIIHPTVVRDVLNDQSNNGLSDILKRSDSGAAKLLGPLDIDEPIEFAGVKFKQTTTTPTVQIGGNTNYNTYIYGEDALFSVFLGKSADGGKNYKLMIQEAPANGSVADPTRAIGGWVAYNVKWTSTLRPGSTMTLRRIQSETSAS